MFKEEYGITLTEYIANLRLEEVKFLLKTADDAIIDIVYSVGFGGLSSFYSFFKGLEYLLWYIEGQVVVIV
ncbi:helix-turn-helix domain-containing protein [Terrisporobacter petrolearius]|uniref:helix-turn-helix domain-containing protein n=1 Tax=Terrisporobacter petrolearius TaxID=1460447 RepID=UPI003A7F1703